MASLVHERHALELGLLNPVKEKYTPRGGNNLCPTLTISNFIEHVCYTTKRTCSRNHFFKPVVMNPSGFKQTRLKKGRDLSA